MVIAAYRVGCVNSVMTDLQGNPARLAKSARALRPFGRDEGARPEKRDLAGALAEGEVLCSRQLARAWTSRGTRFRIAVWWLLGTSTALDEAAFGCRRFVSRAGTGGPSSSAAKQDLPANPP